MSKYFSIVPFRNIVAQKVFFKSIGGNRIICKDNFEKYKSDCEDAIKKDLIDFLNSCNKKTILISTHKLIMDMIPYHCETIKSKRPSSLKIEKIGFLGLKNYLALRHEKWFREFMNRKSDICVIKVYLK